MKKLFYIALLIPFFSNSEVLSIEYYKCIKENVIKYSSINESADSIASASVTSCGSVLAEYLNDSAAFINASSDAKIKFINDMKSQGKEAGIKYAMDEKLKSQKK